MLPLAHLTLLYYESQYTMHVSQSLGPTTITLTSTVVVSETANETVYYYLSPTFIVQSLEGVCEARIILDT